MGGQGADFEPVRGDGVEPAAQLAAVGNELPGVAVLLRRFPCAGNLDAPGAEVLRVAEGFLEVVLENEQGC